MEREKLEREISRYGNILRLVTDEWTVAVLTRMLGEARDRLSKTDRAERVSETSRGTAPRAASRAIATHEGLFGSAAMARGCGRRTISRGTQSTGF